MSTLPVLCPKCDTVVGSIDNDTDTLTISNDISFYEYTVHDKKLTIRCLCHGITHCRMNALKAYQFGNKTYKIGDANSPAVSSSEFVMKEPLKTGIKIPPELAASSITAPSYAEQIVEKEVDLEGIGNKTFAKPPLSWLNDPVAAVTVAPPQSLPAKDEARKAVVDTGKLLAEMSEMEDIIENVSISKDKTPTFARNQTQKMLEETEKLLAMKAEAVATFTNKTPSTSHLPGKYSFTDRFGDRECVFTFQTLEELRAFIKEWNTTDNFHK